MATGLDYALTTPPTAIGKSKVGQPSKGPKKVGVKVKAAIFFDGTGNNQSNITKRLKDSSYMKPSWYQSDSSYASYEQFYSNVALLFFMHKKMVPGERIASVYMEGIGTSNDGPDDTPGGGFGGGPTGVVARVNIGITRLANKVSKLYGRSNPNEYLEELTVYAFGFSRGAAAARHFCARRVDPRGKKNSVSKELGIDPNIIKLKFVGLYDTVSSFDPTGEKTPADPTDTSYVAKAARHLSWREGDKQFRNDVAELHLTLDDPTLGKVVHLVAADEYRLNFSSTTIASAMSRGTGYEVLLPGAHSDIGGGYTQMSPEDREYGWDFPLKVADFFKERGWYTPEQLTKSFRYVSEHHTATILTGRRQVPNYYQFITLSIMLKLAAKANSGMQFGSPNQDEERNIKYVINSNSPLAGIKAKLEGFALSHFGASSTQTATLPPNEYKMLRNKYLHLSWSDRLGFEFRTDASGMPFRLVIPG